MGNKPIRVLQVFAKLGRGGAETMIMNYYRRIDRDKVQFDFVVRSKERMDYEDEIESLGGRIYHVADFKPYNIPLLIKQAKKIFDNTDYKIIHGHLIEAGFFIFREAHMRGIKTIIAHAHNTNHPSVFTGIVKNVILLFQKKMITDYLSCSHEAAIKRFGRKIGQKTIRVWNAIDADSFRFSLNTRNEVRKEMNWEGKFVVMHIGRFSPQKNHMFLLDVFTEIHKRTPNSLLILIGAHEGLEDKVKIKVDSLGLTKDVCFLGGRSDVNHLLQGADIFLFPSLYEGFGIVILEAEASGLKVVTSDSVPREVAVVKEAVDFLSLKFTPEEWAKRVMDAVRGFERKDRYQQIVDSGCDVVQSVEWLQTYYLNCYKR